MMSQSSWKSRSRNALKFCAAAQSCLYLILMSITPASAAVSLDDWLKNEERISIRAVLANISPPDAVRGVVIASPQRENPDYYFHWVRDAALTMNVVVALHESAS